MKLIMDVDTGIDDALAITAALGNEDCELMGITTAFGNVLVETAVRNTLDLLHLLKRDDIPVYPGASCPWGSDEYILHPFTFRVHGLNGIGNVKLEASGREPEKEDASDFMIRMAEEYGDDLVILNLGPLTNMANAIRKNREAISKVKRIVIMGGALTIKGNATEYAEANIINDVQAAQYVLSSGLDLYMVGLDVTLQTIITGREIESWLTVHTEAAEQLFRIAEYYYSNELEIVGGAMHDPLALEVAIDPELIPLWYRCNLDVVQEGEARGRTVSDKIIINKKEKNIFYGLEVDAETFLERFNRHVISML